MKLILTTTAILLALPAFADTLPACERTDKGGYFTYDRGCTERDSRDTDAVRVVEEEPEEEPDPCDGGARCGGEEPVDPVDEPDPQPEPDPAPQPDHEPAGPETPDPVW